MDSGRAQRVLGELGIEAKSITRVVETVSGGQRRGVSVARAAAYGSDGVIVGGPTAALGAVEAREVLELIGRLGRGNCRSPATSACTGSAGASG